LLEDPDGLVAIDTNRFAKLIISLRNAVANEYKLDKEETLYHDILDASTHINTTGKDGKIVENKAIRDDLKFMMKLGAIKPAPEFETLYQGIKGKG
jgi:hypothetical protein